MGHDPDYFHHMSVGEHHAANAWANGACCALGFLGHDCCHSMAADYEAPTDADMLDQGFVMGPGESWVEPEYARERAASFAISSNTLF
jgi:hypothetical protein